MKLGELYKKAVAAGIKADPRDQDEIDRRLGLEKDAFDESKASERELFDEDRLWNPYADTRVLVGELDQEVASVLVGIDMETPEIVLADRLKERGEPIDLVLSHHPEGRALAGLADVMQMQSDIWAERGVPIGAGDLLIAERMREVSRRLSPVNHSRAADAARLLGLAFMSVHTPSDNLVTEYLQNMLDRESPQTPGDILELLAAEPEYRKAVADRSGPFLLTGDEKARTGKIHVEMTGGTEGPKEAIARLAAAGVGTMVGMHFDDKLKDEAEKAKLNVIIAGHISSDSIGMNLLLDGIEEKDMKLLTASGMIRVRR